MTNEENRSSSKFTWIHRLAALPWLADLLAAGGGVLYTTLLFIYAHGRETMLDEGAYLYKGYLFVSGQYSPYQPYGPWTNHTPLAFLIPGYVQELFGAGLRTGRYFVIFTAVMMLFGLWILARRLGNRWWAAGAVWVLAINPILLKTYAIAVSQSLVACMLIWILVLVLGEKRPLWQIILGAILSSIMVMTRINMLPVPPLLLLYVFWQHGKKAGIASALAAGLAFFGLHAIYWPDILQVWTRLPKALTPFLNEWRVEGNSFWQPNYSFTSRVLSLFGTFRMQFTAMLGVLAFMSLWPPKNRWKSQADLRSAAFLFILFLALFFTHVWAALGMDYCVFCLPGYIAFFSEAGLLLLILTFSAWRQRLPAWHQGLTSVLIVALFTGIGFSTFEDLGEPLYNIQIPRWLLGDSSGGFASLGAILINKFNLDPYLLRRLLPSLWGALVGALVLVIALGIRMYSKRYTGYRENIAAIYPDRSFGYWAIVSALIVGTVLSPTALMGGGTTMYDCTGDVILSNEVAGEHLAMLIKPGSRVYWKGGLSVTPLLYVPNIHIYPAQINGDYSFMTSGETERIHYMGKWNQELAERWANEADYILIEEHFYEGWLKLFVKTGSFLELEPTPLTVPCRADSYIRIFERSQ